MANAPDPYELEEALNGLSQTEYGSLLPSIRQIVSNNVANGRAQKFLKTDGTYSIADYVQRVAQTIKGEIEELQRLSAKDETAWASLHRKLRTQAYLKLLRMGVDHHEAYQRANDFAQDACLDVLKASYPADVPHTAWAQRILYNQILQELWRKPDTLDIRAAIFSLQDGEELIDPYVEEMDETADRQVNRKLIESVLNQLPSEAQRTVLHLDLEGCPDEDIAAQIGRTVQAVYNLRRRAMQNIRRLLAPSKTQIAE